MNEAAQTLAQNAIQHALSQSRVSVQRTMDTVNSDLPKVVAALDQVETQLGTLSAAQAEAGPRLQQTADTLDAIKTVISTATTHIVKIERTTADVQAQVQANTNEVKKSNALLEAFKWQNTVQILQAGIANAEHIGTFEHYDNRSGTMRLSSTHCVRQVLSIFMQRKHVTIVDTLYVHTESVKQPKEEHKEAFRKKLCEAVYMLTGTEPRLVRQQSAGSAWALYRE